MQVWAFCISRRPVRIARKSMASRQAISPRPAARKTCEQQRSVSHAMSATSELPSSCRCVTEAPKDGIFSCDVGGQVIAAVDASRMLSASSAR